MRIPRVLVLLTLLATCNAALAQAPRRVQLSFSGTTSASQLLIQDVMRNVMAIGDEELGCQMPGAVTAEVLPADFQALAPQPAPEGARRTVHERWTINFCGKEIPFLLTFWTLQQGGTAFDLDYPALETLAAAEATETQLR